MPFEAKFLNLSSDTYNIEIINPTNFEVENSIRIKATENKSCKLVGTRISFYLKNVTSKNEKLFFDLQQMELYTIDKDYQKGESIIKNDILNKKYFGESVSISDEDFIEELKRRSSVNLSPDKNLQINSRNPSVFNISLQNDSINTNLNNKNGVVSTATTNSLTKPAENNPSYANLKTNVNVNSSNVNPYAKNYVPNTNNVKIVNTSTSTSNVENANSNVNKVLTNYLRSSIQNVVKLPAVSTSVGSGSVGYQNTIGNYSNYKPVVSTSVDSAIVRPQVGQMSKSVYESYSNYQSNPYASKGTYQAGNYSYGNSNFGANTNQTTNTRTTPLTTSNYTPSNYTIGNNGYTGSYGTNIKSNMTQSLKEIIPVGIPENNVKAYVNPYSSRNTTTTTTTIKDDNKPSVQADTVDNNTNSYASNANNYSTTQNSIYPSSTYQKDNNSKTNNYNYSNITYGVGVGSSYAQSNYNLANTVTYKPSSNVNYQQTKNLDTTIPNSTEIKSNEGTVKDYNKNNIYPYNAQNNYTSNIVGKVITVKSDSAYKSKPGSSRVMATVTTEGKKLSDIYNDLNNQTNLIKDTDNKNVEIVQPVTNNNYQSLLNNTYQPVNNNTYQQQNNNSSQPSNNTYRSVTNNIYQPSINDNQPLINNTNQRINYNPYQTPNNTYNTLNNFENKTSSDNVPEQVKIVETPVYGIQQAVETPVYGNQQAVETPVYGYQQAVETPVNGNQQAVETPVYGYQQAVETPVNGNQQAVETPVYGIQQPMDNNTERNSVEFNVDSYISNLIKQLPEINLNSNGNNPNTLDFRRKESFFDINSIMQNYFNTPILNVDKKDTSENYNLNLQNSSLSYQQASPKIDVSNVSIRSKQSIEEVVTPVKLDSLNQSLNNIKEIQAEQNNLKPEISSNISLKNFSEDNSLIESPERNAIKPKMSMDSSLNMTDSLRRKESVKITKKQNELIKKFSIDISDKSKIAELEVKEEEEKILDKSVKVSIDFAGIENYSKNIKDLEKSTFGITSSVKYRAGNNVFNSDKKGKITIMNMDKEEVYVRVSGNSEKDEELNLLKPNKMLKFERENNKIHKLQICNDKITKRGPVYNIYSDCSYKIINHQLKNEVAGDFTNLSSNKFSENNNNNNKYFVYFDQNSLIDIKNILALKSERFISLFNASSNEIRIRVEAEKSNDDDISVIYPLMGLAIEKTVSHVEKLTEIKQGQRIYKYMLKTNNVYYFDQEGLLINAEDSTIINPASNELRINNELSLKNKNIVTNINNNPKNNKDIYFTFDDLNLDEENLNEFCLDNFSNEDLYTRIETQAEGNDDFFLLKKGEEKWNLREDGLFLVEFVRQNLQSKRYIVNTNYCYQIDKEINLRESNSMKLIAPVFERFKGFTIEINGKILPIDYNSEHNLMSAENDKYNELKYYDNKAPIFKRGHIFIDDNFPASNHIIANDEDTHYPHSAEEVGKEILANTVFKRPNDIFADPIYLFNDNNDDQLSFITFITSILNAINYNNPANIKRIIRSKEINPQGLYEVYFYDVDKIKKIMYVDDQFPVEKTKVKSNRYFYSEFNSNEIWLQILEKAFAKYEGGYSNVMDGNIINELYFFTGAISFRYENNDPNCWEYLKASDDPSTITLATMKKDQTNKINEIGLYDTVYSILNVDEFYDSESKEIIKLIKLRNLNINSTNNVYSYSKKSKKWTPELKKFFNFDLSFKDNAVFFMTFEEFQKNFDSFITSYIN